MNKRNDALKRNPIVGLISFLCLGVLVKIWFMISSHQRFETDVGIPIDRLDL